jgi:hypothetical protein
MANGKQVRTSKEVYGKIRYRRKIETTFLFPAPTVGAWIGTSCMQYHCLAYHLHTVYTSFQGSSGNYVITRAISDMYKK